MGCTAARVDRTNRHSTSRWKRTFQCGLANEEEIEKWSHIYHHLKWQLLNKYSLPPLPGAMVAKGDVDRAVCSFFLQQQLFRFRIPNVFAIHHEERDSSGKIVKL